MPRISISIVLLLTVSLLLAGCQKSETTITQTPAQEVEKATEESVQATEMGAEQAVMSTQEVQDKLSNITSLINQGSLDLAESELQSLESQKSSFSSDLQNQIDAARTSLNAAKSMQEIKTPSWED